MSYFIVLDQGSSSSRALLTDNSGNILVQERVEILPLHKGPGRAEYDAGELLASQISAFEALLNNIDKNIKITSIAVTSQRSTIVFWDRDTGEPLAPALSWQDMRAGAETAAAALTQDEIHDITGLYKTPAFSAPKIAWALKNYPELKNKNLCAGPVASYVIWHLTNGAVFAADPTLAQRTLLFNIKTHEWDDKLLSAFGINKDILPEVKPTMADYGSYKGIPITVCAGDQQAAAVGIGAMRRADCALNYGTGAFLLVNTGTELRNIAGILTSCAIGLNNNKSYVLEGPVNVAGAVFSWLAAAGLSFDIKELDTLASKSQDGSLLFLPAFGGLGAPYWRTDIPTTITGLKPGTKKEDILAAAAKSIDFLLADIYFYLLKNGVEINNIKASGGLARNEFFLKFQADILQKSITQALHPEATALGAAYAAAVAAGADVSGWNKGQAIKVFDPAISPGEAAALYTNWRKFFSWNEQFKPQ